MQEFFGQYVDVITGLSVGTVALLIWRIASFFKKDKYLLPFINIAKTKSVELFGKENVNAFLSEVNDLKVSDIKPALQDFSKRFNDMETLLKLLLSNQLALGVYDDNPVVKETIEKLL